MNKYSFKIEENLDRVRLDKAAAFLSDLTRSRIQQLIKSGQVILNNKQEFDGSKLISTNDIIIITVPPPIDTTMRASDISLDIIFEDKDLLVINKQSGLTVHPGAGQHTDTLANALINHCGDSLSGIGGVTRPGIVHRLDRDTSGLMVVAKNDIAHVDLSKQIENRSLKRVYKAIVFGTPIPHEGIISTNIGRNMKDRTKMQVMRTGGKNAKTNYKVIDILPFASIVECRLDTGRTHQIRVHMNHIGHSIIGDQVYGSNLRKISSSYKGENGNKIKLFNRQALHSCYIEFIHPTTKKILNFSSDLPNDMLELIKILRETE